MIFIRIFSWIVKRIVIAVLFFPPVFLTLLNFELDLEKIQDPSHQGEKMSWLSCLYMAIQEFISGMKGAIIIDLILLTVGYVIYFFIIEPIVYEINEGKR